VHVVEANLFFGIAASNEVNPMIEFEEYVPLPRIWDSSKRLSLFPFELVKLKNNQVVQENSCGVASENPDVAEVVGHAETFSGQRRLTRYNGFTPALIHKVGYVDLVRVAFADVTSKEYCVAIGSHGHFVIRARFWWYSFPEELVPTPLSRYGYQIYAFKVEDVKIGNESVKS
jgi:hypothetical protein